MCLGRMRGNEIKPKIERLHTNLLNAHKLHITDIHSRIAYRSNICADVIAIPAKLQPRVVAIVPASA